MISNFWKGIHSYVYPGIIYELSSSRLSCTTLSIMWWLLAWQVGEVQGSEIWILIWLLCMNIQREVIHPGSVQLRVMVSLSMGWEVQHTIGRHLVGYISSVHWQSDIESVWEGQEFSVFLVHSQHVKSLNPQLWSGQIPHPKGKIVNNPSDWGSWIWFWFLVNIFRWYRWGCQGV